jgi:hypothetical protein
MVEIVSPFGVIFIVECKLKIVFLYLSSFFPSLLSVSICVIGN